jgi:hypothetical protein
MFQTKRFLAVVLATAVFASGTSVWAQKADVKKPDAPKPDADNKKPDAKPNADKNPNADNKNPKGDKAPNAAGLYAVVKAVDAAKRTITVTVTDKTQKEPMEQTLAVAANAPIIIAGGGAKVKGAGAGAGAEQGGGKLSDLGEGTHLILTMDQKTVVAINVPPQALNGTMKAVDADKKTITVSVPKGKADMEDQTFALADGAVGTGKGAVEMAVLRDWATKGEKVTLRLTADRKSVTGVSVQQQGGGKGVNKAPEEKKEAPANKDNPKNPPANKDGAKKEAADKNAPANK